jgi:hypothetical protein
MSIWPSFVCEPHEEHYDSQSSKQDLLASRTKLRQYGESTRAVDLRDKSPFLLPNILLLAQPSGHGSLTYCGIVAG